MCLTYAPRLLRPSARGKCIRRFAWPVRPDRAAGSRQRQDAAPCGHNFLFDIPLQRGSCRLYHTPMLAASATWATRPVSALPQLAAAKWIDATRLGKLASTLRTLSL